MKIRPDGISIFFDVLVVVGLLFLLVSYQGSFNSFFAGSVIASLLLLAAIALDPLATKGDDDVEDTDSEDFKLIIGYTVAAIAVFYALALFVPVIPSQLLKQLSVAGPLSAISVGGIFLIQIAVAEAEFFHRFLTNVFVSRISFLGFPAVGGVAAVYHLFVYGDSPTNLVIVFGAFSTLAFISWHTGRVSPVMIAHVVNNGISSGLFSLSSLGLPHQVVGISQGNLVLAAFSIAVSVVLEGPHLAHQKSGETDDGGLDSESDYARQGKRGEYQIPGNPFVDPHHPVADHLPERLPGEERRQA